MNGKPILGILLGDAAGVGPEIIAKLAASRFYDEYCRPVVIGDVRVFERGARICGLEIPVQVIQYGDPDNSGSDLAGHNQVYLRAEFYIGWAILAPAFFAKIEA